MESPKKTQGVLVKVPLGVLAEIDRNIEEGMFSSRPDFMLTATRFYLDCIESRKDARRKAKDEEDWYNDTR